MHDLRSMERNLQDHTHKLATLLDVARDLASTLELKPLLVLILKRIRNVVQYTNAGIAMLEDDNFKIVEFQGPVSREKMLHFQVPLSLDSGYRRVMQSGRPVIIGDIWQNDPWLNNLHSATESAILEMYRDIHSWVGVPLMIRDDLVGILRLDHEVPYYYTEERMRLIMAFADHVALAIQNARVHEQSRKLSVMKERQKLARELHDSVSQALYGIALGLQTSQILLERDPTQLKAPLEYCLALANTGMAEMRALIFELRPESLELEGVVMALTKRAAALCGRYGIEVCETYCPEPPVSMAVKEAIFRIAQEALQNVIKHSQATSVEICLEEGDKTLELTLRDNGRGFKTTGFHPGHLGLKSMEERAEQVGGSFTLQSAPGQGTRIHVRIPVA
jgi:signal transduction histidine kinase